jgi:hypothetical protein
VEHRLSRFSDDRPAPKRLGVKVCPHCAEELPDEATVCSTCGKDPALAPAWATPRRSDELPPSPQNMWDPSGVPRTADGVPPYFKDLEPDAARHGSLGIPWKVWVSLALAFGWSFVLFAVTPRLVGGGLYLLPVGYAVGLILGIMGRTEVTESDRLGQILSIIAIGMNAIRLAMTVFTILPYASTFRG